MSQEKVYLVAAGPGDVELITFKGYQLICQADVILHNHLIPSELLRFAKMTSEAIRLCAGWHQSLLSGAANIKRGKKA